MAHLLEHLVFKGTPRHPEHARGAQRTRRAVQRHHLVRSHQLLRDPRRQRRQPRVGRSTLEADRHGQQLHRRQGPRHRDDRGAQRVRERARTTRPACCGSGCSPTAYRWHNYGKSTIGTRSDIERVPIENLRAFYRKYYQPDNAVLVVAGKFDEAKTLGLVEKHFGAIPRPARALPRAYTVEPPQDGERTVDPAPRRRRADRRRAVPHAGGRASRLRRGGQRWREILTNEPVGRLYKALVETGKASSVDGAVRAARPRLRWSSRRRCRTDKPLDDARRDARVARRLPRSRSPTTRSSARARSSLKSFDQTYNNRERSASRSPSTSPRATGGCCSCTATAGARSRRTTCTRVAADVPQARQPHARAVPAGRAARSRARGGAGRRRDAGQGLQGDARRAQARCSTRRRPTSRRAPAAQLPGG